MENFDLLVAIGTSHTRETFNPIKDLVNERYNVNGYNYGVVSLGIDSYFTRIHGILKKHKNKKCLIIAEIPSLGRFQEYVYKNNLEYKPWSIIDDIDIFWGNYDKWTLFIEYYNISKLYSGLTNWKRSIEKALLRVKTNNHTNLYEEDLISKIIALDALMSVNNHKVLWFSFDNYLVLQNRVKEEFNQHNVNLLSDCVLDQQIKKIYGYNDNSIYENKNIYVDGFHASKEVWKVLIETYFYETLDKLLTKKQ